MAYDILILYLSFVICGREIRTPANFLNLKKNPELIPMFTLFGTSVSAFVTAEGKSAEYAVLETQIFMTVCIRILTDV